MRVYAWTRPREGVFYFYPLRVAILFSARQFDNFFNNLAAILLPRARYKTINSNRLYRRGVQTARINSSLDCTRRLVVPAITKKMQFPE